MSPLWRMETTTARFWGRVAQSPVPEACWLWLGTMTAAGYGQLKVMGARVYAHRFSYEQVKGPIPDGMVVRHTCDRPGCVNPTHLVLGTQTDNMRDAAARGRLKPWAAAKTHCKHGHPLSGDNLGVRQGKYRRCRACGRNAYHRAKIARSATRSATSPKKKIPYHG